MSHFPAMQPCPFCGGDARTGYIRDGRHGFCTKCHAAGPPAHNGGLSAPSAEFHARELWNKRAAPPAVPADVEGR